MVVAAFALWSWFFLYSTPEDVEVVIPRGLTLAATAEVLEEKGVVRSALALRLYFLWHGTDSRVVAGEYRFPAGVTLGDVHRMLVEGRVVTHRVSIPEGLTIEQTARLLEEKGVVPSKEFIAAARDPALARRLLGVEVSSLEGYLYPDTYAFAHGVGARAVIRRMVSRFKEVYASLHHPPTALSRHEIVTIASIIEKETSAPEERPLISAVIHNRLRRGMKLECDPTVIYGLGAGFDGNLRRSDLESDNPYNTYVHAGLPPGPIANPGRASLEAALNPAPVDYLFFVSMGNGRHKFSRTYREHAAAVRRYQMGR